MTTSVTAVSVPKLPNWLAASFNDLESGLNGERASELHSLRKTAFNEVSDVGFPTTHREEWKYTNLRELPKTAFLLAQRRDSLASAERCQAILAAIERTGPRLVFVNGFFVAELSSMAFLSEGLEIVSLCEVLKEATHELYPRAMEFLQNSPRAVHSPFVALNTAFVQDGVFLRVRKNIAISEPVELVFLTDAESSPIASYPRTMIVAEEGAALTFVERYVGTGEKPYFTSPVTEVAVGESAMVNHIKIQEESLSSHHLSMMTTSVGRSGRFSTAVFHFGGKLVRNEIMPVLNGEGGEVVLNGVTVIGSGQHVDNDTVIDHATAHCQSNELYKGVFAGDATSAFSGTIIVRPGAQKTNALQSNNNLLLSDEATINTRPQLKIWADDVKCTHGATVGQLDEQALFYLRSRGISKDEARNMLIRAFIGELVQAVNVETFRGYLDQRLVSRLEEFNV